jgi:hypothetical protein
MATWRLGRVARPRRSAPARWPALMRRVASTPSMSVPSQAIRVENAALSAPSQMTGGSVENPTRCGRCQGFDRREVSIVQAASTGCRSKKRDGGGPEGHQGSAGVGRGSRLARWALLGMRIPSGPPYGGGRGDLLALLESSIRTLGWHRRRRCQSSCLLGIPRLGPLLAVRQQGDRPHGRLGPVLELP